MKISKINLLNSFLVTLFLLLILATNASADTTFFDNPDDVFIMGNSPTGGGVIEETTGGTTSGGGCLYKWNCTSWGKCLKTEKQTRNCTNIGTCPSVYNAPEIEQDCTPHTSTEVEKEKQDETGEINQEKNVSKDKIFLYFVVILMIGFIVFYLKKNYFRGLINRILDKYQYTFIQ